MEATDGSKDIVPVVAPEATAGDDIGSPTLNIPLVEDKRQKQVRA